MEGKPRELGSAVSLAFLVLIRVLQQQGKNAFILIVKGDSVSLAPCYNNELLVFSAVRSSSRTGFGLPLEEARKEADFLSAWGHLSMTMWKQTQSIPAPSLPEPVLPCN